MSIPEGLRDVIGKRLSLLSPECNQLLSAASVIGREFDLEILRDVTDIDEEVFVNALNEAVQLSIIEERSQVGHVRYRFTHAFFRQTLYEELIAPRRLRLHQQVARALEKHYAKRLDEHAVELAEHFSQSTGAADLKKAVKYGEMAAQRAANVYAYGEAVRLLEQTINVQKVLNPDDKEKICDLLLDLCDNLFFLPDTKRIIELEAPAACSLAESLDDATRIVRTCIIAIGATQYEQGNAAWTSLETHEWASKADRYAKPDTVERARTDIYLGAIKCNQGDVVSGLKLISQGMDLAHRTGDQETIILGLSMLLFRRTAPQHTEERIRLAEQLSASLGTGIDIRQTYNSFFMLADTFLATGQRNRAEDFFKKHQSLALRVEAVALKVTSLTIDAIISMMDGRLEDITEITEKIRILCEESGIGGVSDTYMRLASTRTCIYKGESLEDIEGNIPSGVPILMPERCLLLSHLGKKEEVLELLEENVVRRPDIGTDDDVTDAWKDILLLEAAIIIEHRKAAELLLNRLAGTSLCTTGWRLPTCVQRHLGGAAALLGRYDKARQYYQEAIKVCTEMPFRPELALSKLQLAELLFEHYPDEKKEALEHIDFAIKEFREMKMQPSLERVLRHKDILKA